MGKTAISEGTERRITEVALGTVVAQHPVHLGLVQVWLAWKGTQSEYHASTTTTNFAADAGTTTKRALNALCGYIDADSYHYGEVTKWTWNINEAWLERGIPRGLWVTARPDMTFTAIVRERGVAP